jgi:cell wall-associated NlpC family hydrolase
MHIRSLLTVLAFVPACFLVPAAADTTIDPTPAAAPLESISPEACIAKAKGMHLAQIQTACCNGHKGICGCRAGKIVCCDNSTSKEPGCTCHGDEGVTE